MMFLGLYIFFRAIVWVMTWAIIATIGVIIVIGMILAAIGTMLLDPDTWRGHPKLNVRRGVASDVSTFTPRNPRMYHSSRR